MLNFSFKIWLEEISIGEYQPPEGYTGPGLICFDFDKTLTTAIPVSSRLASTANPNKVMVDKLKKHKINGNYCVIITGRGTDIDVGQSYLKHTSISVFDAINKWNLSRYIDEVIMTGGVSRNDLENKSFKIISTMRKYKVSWGILYDDNIKNINQINNLGTSLRGILVSPTIDTGV